MPAHAHLGWVNPVIAHDFPDPGVRFDPRNGKNVQCSYSYDFCTWHHHEQDVLPGPLPPWLDQPGFIWAPEIIQAPQNRGGWLMYVTVPNRAVDKQCIAVAYTSSGPLGPYHFITAGPLVDHPETGGCLDPQPFEDPISGKRFLVYKADEDHMHTRKNQVWIWELGEDGISLVGNRRPLLRPTQPWQGNLIEAPYLTYHQASNSYCLFYSSGTFTTEGYAPSFAISRNGIFGPYEPATSPLLFTDNVRVVQGVEGHFFFIFHALAHEGGPRPTCVQRLEFNDHRIPSLAGRPNVGKRLRLLAEAEDDQAHGFGPPPVHNQPAPAGQPSNLPLQPQLNANGSGIGRPATNFPGPLRPGGNIYAQGGGAPSKIAGALSNFKEGMFDKK
ncbi:hypothetical protein V8E36_002835 [Tilletia maclaganii]